MALVHICNVLLTGRRCNDCTGKTDAKSVPATKVHLLVEELARYLPDDIKRRYEE